MMNSYEQVTVALIVYVSTCLSTVLFVYFFFHKFNDHVTSLLTMLAVGTLIGDAFLHLIPKSLGLHNDVPMGSNYTTNHVINDKTHESDDRFIIYKCLLVVFSLYALYVVNAFIILIKCEHTHGHGKRDSTLPQSKKSLHKLQDIIRDVTPVANEEKHIDCFELKGISQISKRSSSKPVERSSSASHVVYGIIMSSVLHNITDGLAIGVAFSDNVSGGLSTTIAVLCHEVPHVIGHFVVIHLAGLSIHLSLCVVMVSYLSTFVGSYIGVTIGTHFNASEWIFAVTSGMFLYVALVQLLPVMTKNIHETRSWCKFLFQNVGFLSGLGIMFFIAIYESSIQIVLSH